MALQITGKIEMLGATQTVASKKGGEPFKKRDVVLAVCVYDRYTGEVVSENHPQFEFGGSKCDKLDGCKVGDMVTISFVVQGVWYEKDGERKNLTKVVGYDIQPYKKATEESKPVQQAAPAQAQEPQDMPPVPPMNDGLPF